MRRLGGWQRLWVVVAVLWGLLVVAVAALDSGVEIDIALMVWLVPVSGLYALGASVGWIVRGFRSIEEAPARLEDRVSSTQHEKRPGTDADDLSSHLVWSENPGPCEAHLLRRFDNPLFPTKRRIVTAQELNDAKLRDEEEYQQFRVAFEAFTLRIAQLPDEIDTKEINPLPELLRCW